MWLYCGTFKNDITKRNILVWCESTGKVKVIFTPIATEQATARTSISDGCSTKKQVEAYWECKVGNTKAPKIIKKYLLLKTYHIVCSSTQALHQTKRPHHTNCHKSHISRGPATAEQLLLSCCENRNAHFSSTLFFYTVFVLSRKYP